MQDDHFKGRSAFEHILEAQAKGLSASSEIHGAETPGTYFAFLDAARESALLFASVVLLLSFLPLTLHQRLEVMIALGCSWLFWKGARGVWLAYARLERLHRIALEEKNEIEQHRSQERDELIVLYGAKGFKGELLDQVVDVLMADQDRLLQVMLQEEMGFRLEENEHPLLQGICAAIGAFLPFLLFSPLMYFFSHWVASMGALLFMAAIGCLVASSEKNARIAAFSWNFMVGAIVLVFAYTTMSIVLGVV